MGLTVRRECAWISGKRDMQSWHHANRTQQVASNPEAKRAQRRMDRGRPVAAHGEEGNLDEEDDIGEEVKAVERTFHTRARAVDESEQIILAGEEQPLGARSVWLVQGLSLSVGTCRNTTSPSPSTLEPLPPRRQGQRFG